FGDGRLAHASFANQDWIVLGPAAKDLYYPLDFIAPANYGIEFPLPRQLSQVAAECAKCWSLDVFLRRLDPFLLRFRRREVWIELFKDLIAGTFDIEFETLQHSGSDAFALSQQSKQNVFGADVRMIKRLRFFACQRQHFFDARRIGNVTYDLGFRPRADLFLHLHADGLKIEPHLLQDVNRHALAKFDESQKQMLRTDVVVVKPVGF